MINFVLISNCLPEGNADEDEEGIENNKTVIKKKGVRESDRLLNSKTLGRVALSEPRYICGVALHAELVLAGRA